MSLTRYKIFTLQPQYWLKSSEISEEEFQIDEGATSSSINILNENIIT